LEKKVKFQKVTIDANDEHDFTGDLYVCPRVEFAWLSKLSPKKKVARLLTDFHSCRETFTGAFGEVFDPEIKRPIPKDQTCIALYKQYATEPTAKRRKLFESKLAKSLKIIHHYEKMAGWKRTRVYRARVIDDGHTIENILVYVVNGSNRWIRGPQLLSLYVLLLRAGNLTRLPTEFETEKQLQAGFKKMLSGYAGRGGDVGFLASTHSKFPYLILNASSIYKDITMRTLWKDAPQWEGIGKLCQGVCANDLVLKRFKKALGQIG
jgi:hypothetical protein